ncbi:MAG: hypothetical protein K2Y32_10305 [Candidatus Obscuribacterales bacterium]|nr:hypothetical protein [Candidatus Obscuribacterales bacterium]
MTASNTNAMQAAFAGFIASKSGDQLDRIARNAICVALQLLQQQQSAYDQGDQEGFAAVHQGIETAVTAFALVHAERPFSFADHAFAKMDVDAEAGKALSEAVEELHDKPGKAAQLVNQAAMVVSAYAERLKPVFAVRGVTSCRILRGAHCLPYLAQAAQLAQDGLLNDN